MKKDKLLKVLLAPHTTEKAANASGSDCPQYAFKVATFANKVEIKAAVEQLFQVKVKAVNVLRQKGAVARKFGRSVGRQGTWKKAYVVLQPGHEISIA